MTARLTFAIIVLCSSAAAAQTVTQRGFLETSAVGFPQSAPNDSVRNVEDVLFREEVFLRPTTWFSFAGGVDFRLNSHGQVGDEWTVDFYDRTVLRPRIAVRRLNVTISRGNFTLDIGKHLIRWGRADILNPTDRFAPHDFLNVIDAEVLPVVAARPAIQAGSETFEGVWVPRLTPSRLPLFHQRWTVLPADSGVSTIEDGGALIPRRSQWGARWAHAGERLEFSISYFDGLNHLPNIHERINPETGSAVLTRVHPELRTYGGDIAIPMGWLSVKGEVAYFAFPSSANAEYVVYVVEAERQIGEWLLDAGYIGEVVTQPGDAFVFALDRGLARSIIGRGSYTVDPRRTITIEGAAHQSGDGFYAKGEFSEALGQHWRLTLTSVYITGQDDNFIGQYRTNSHAAATLRFSF